MQQLQAPQLDARQQNVEGSSWCLACICFSRLLLSFISICCASDGYPVDTSNQHEVNELQRGPLGSTTVLTIAPKDPSQEVKTVYLERRPLPQPPLKQVSS